MLQVVKLSTIENQSRLMRAALLTFLLLLPMVSEAEKPYFGGYAGSDELITLFLKPLRAFLSQTVREDFVIQTSKNPAMLWVSPAGEVRTPQAALLMIIVRKTIAPNEMSDELLFFSEGAPFGAIKFRRVGENLSSISEDEILAGVFPNSERTSLYEITTSGFNFKASQ